MGYFLDKRGDFVNEIILTPFHQEWLFLHRRKHMVSIFDDMTQITEAEVQRLLPLVDEQRRNEALRYKHLFGQYTCLKSWLMLKELLKPLGINDLKMNYNGHGKPFLFNHPKVCFNISHCKNGIAVVVDSSPVGIDIESFRRNTIALVRKTMNAAEAEWIRTSSDPIETFTQFWTKKEAVVKLRGTSITDDLHRVLNGEDYRLETYLNRKKRYAWSVAYTQ